MFSGDEFEKNTPKLGFFLFFFLHGTEASYVLLVAGSAIPSTPWEKPSGAPARQRHSFSSPVGHRLGKRQIYISLRSVPTAHPALMFPAHKQLPARTAGASKALCKLTSAAGCPKSPAQPPSTILPCGVSPTCTVETWFYTLRKEMTEQKILIFSSSSFFIFSCKQEKQGGTVSNCMSASQHSVQQLLLHGVMLPRQHPVLPARFLGVESPSILLNKSFLNAKQQPIQCTVHGLLRFCH